LCNKGPLKLSPQAALWRHSPPKKKLKLVKSFGKSFAKKQKKFHHIFEAVSPFGDFFAKNKNQ
jgi:hypothetical protein